MEPYEAIRIVYNEEEKIVVETRDKHKEEIHVAESAIALILSMLPNSVTIELTNIEETLLPRYLGTISIRANWVMRCLVAGSYSSAFSLMRVVFEELISLEYFLKYPAAARQAITNEDYIEPKLSKKLQALKAAPQFTKIASMLSTGYIHPKVNLVAQKENQPILEPFYTTYMANLGFRVLLPILQQSLLRAVTISQNIDNQQLINEVTQIVEDINSLEEKFNSL